MTVFYGPSGAGKTTMLGAIAFALTGHFPGVGQTAGDIGAIATSPTCFAEVQADAPDGEVFVRRGVADGKLFVEVREPRELEDGQHYLHRWTKPTEARAAIGRRFGDVATMCAPVDLAQSVWTQSAELQKRWAFDLCAPHAGWTPERLRAVLPPDFVLFADAPYEALAAAIAQSCERKRRLLQAAKEARLVAEHLRAAAPFTDEAVLLREAMHCTDSAAQANAEVLRLGESLATLCRVRDQILDDGAPALRRALARLCAWAPRGSLWEVDGGLVGLRRRDGTFVGMDLMSDGERVRGIAACQVASCAITSAPWRVLLLDNIEHVSTPERTALLAALADLSRDGKLDNVLVAGALDAPPAHGTSLLLEAP